LHADQLWPVAWQPTTTTSEVGVAMVDVIAVDVVGAEVLRVDVRGWASSEVGGAGVIWMSMDWDCLTTVV